MKQLKAYRPLQICLLDTLCIEEMCLKCLSKVNSFKKYLNILITIPTNKSFPWKSDMRGLLNVYVTKFVCETHQFAISRCHFSHPPGPYRWHSYLYGCHIYFPSLNLYDSSSNWREDLNRECVFVQFIYVKNHSGGRCVCERLGVTDCSRLRLNQLQLRWKDVKFPNPTSNPVSLVLILQ